MGEVVLLVLGFISSCSFCIATCCCCRTLRQDCGPYRERIKCRVWMPALVICIVGSVLFHGLVAPMYNQISHKEASLRLGVVGALGDGVGLFTGAVFFCCCLVRFTPHRVNEEGLAHAQKDREESLTAVAAQLGGDQIEIYISPTIAEHDLQVTVSKSFYISHLISQLPYEPLQKPVLDDTETNPYDTEPNSPAGTQPSRLEVPQMGVPSSSGNWFEAWTAAPEIVFGSKVIGGGSTGDASLSSHGVESGAILQLANASLAPAVHKFHVSEPQPLPEPHEDDFVEECESPDVTFGDIYSFRSYVSQFPNSKRVVSRNSLVLLSGLVAWSSLYGVSRRVER